MSDSVDCPVCEYANEERHARFCGRCGVVLGESDGAGESDAVGEGPLDGSNEARSGLSRRRFGAGAAGLLLGGVVGALWGRHDAAQPPDATVELPEATFEVGEARRVIERIASDGPILFPRESPRVAVTTWDPAAQADGMTARQVYGEEGERHPVIAGTGLMALSLRSTHLGCATPYCESSGWFEDPCHGSKWNRWGEWTAGPAPRGLDRFGSTIRPDGTLVVHLTVHQLGPPREPRFGGSQPSGPICLEM